jgi:hypothetical protein
VNQVFGVEIILIFVIEVHVHWWMDDCEGAYELSTFINFGKCTELIITSLLHAPRH